MTDLVNIAATEPKFNGKGQYLITPDGGGKPVAMSRATTIAGTLEDRHNLEKYFKRQVAVGMAQSPHLCAAVATTDLDDKKELLRIADEALTAAKSDAAGKIGTALHKATELHDLGEPVPTMFEERVTEYARALTAAGIEVCADAIEQIHVLNLHRIAGTADRHVTHNGERYIFDLKTGEGLHQDTFAVQLAIYANADTLYDPATETHKPMPAINKDFAIVCHLPAKGGECVLYWLDIAAGAEALQHSLWARTWRLRKDLLDPFTVDSVDTDDTPRSQRIVEQLPAVKDEAFILRWRTRLPGIAGPKRHTEWTNHQCNQIEREFELTFTDPTQPVAPYVDHQPTPPPTPAPVDTGGPYCDPTDVTELRALWNSRDNIAKQWTSAWHLETIAAGLTWRMNRDGHITVQSYEQSRAAYWLSLVAEACAGIDTPLEDVERCIRTVGVTITDGIGTTLANMTTGQATECAAIAQALMECNVKLTDDGLFETL
jgi:hypothetical protein